MIGPQWRGARPDPLLRRDATSRCLTPAFALLIYLAALSGTGLIALHDTLHAASRSSAATLTLLAPADTSSARLETVLAMLRQTRGVVSVHLLEPAETARLLEPWLGPSAPIDELPVPRLIEARLDPNGSTDLGALRQHLASVAPGTQLHEHHAWLTQVRRAVHRIDGVLIAAIAGALLLTAMSAVVVTDIGLATQRSVVELLHLLGASDTAIAGPLAMRSLRWGLLGGAIGAGAALVTIIALRGVGSALPLPAPGATIAMADWRVWAVLTGVVLAAGLIAMAGARITVLRRLARMP